ncbi:MAG: dihydroxy-acid dehydratase, partial [Mariniblastus sp.]|nr:dihydroxy-acid dehydratase [Mariniblastus sp.]
TAQITFALKYLSHGKHVALITDGRFSGVSTGPCIGHLSPEAMAGGPIGKVRDGDEIRIEIDTQNLSGIVEFVGDLRELQARPMHPQLRQHPELPDDTRLWAALQQVSGGTWGGCVYDVDRIIKRLNDPS